MLCRTHCGWRLWRPAAMLGGKGRGSPWHRRQGERGEEEGHWKKARMKTRATQPTMTVRARRGPTDATSAATRRAGTSPPRHTRRATSLAS